MDSFIQGQRDSLTDSLVVERLFGVVEDDEVRASGRASIPLQVFVVLNGGTASGRSGVADVDFTVLHSHDNGVGVEDDLEGDVLDGGSAVIVIVVGSQSDLVANFPAAEFVRAGADRVTGKGVGIRFICALADDGELSEGDAGFCSREKLPSEQALQCCRQLFPCGPWQK